MAVTSGGGSEIVVVDLASRASRRLTDAGSINVSPCYSPDGSQIVFNSDRDGDQQLYIMGAGGGGAKRISFGSGKYATPVWSPRGDLIAFTRFGGDEANFSIGVMHPDGSGERMLAEGWDVEGPTWAPNGRVMMFESQSRAHECPRRRVFLAPGVGGHHRLQRTRCPDADRRVGSGMVAARGREGGGRRIARPSKELTHRGAHCPPVMAGP